MRTGGNEGNEARVTALSSGMCAVQREPRSDESTITYTALTLKADVLAAA
jgi:hypothetical protein